MYSPLIGRPDQGPVQPVLGQPRNCCNCSILRQNIMVLEHSLRTKSYLLAQSEDLTLLLQAQNRQLRAFVEQARTVGFEPIGMLDTVSVAEVPRSSSSTSSESLNLMSAQISIPSTSTDGGGGGSSGIFENGRPSSDQEEIRNSSSQESLTNGLSERSDCEMSGSGNVGLVASDCDLVESSEIEIIEVVSMAQNQRAANITEGNEPLNGTTDNVPDNSNSCTQVTNAASCGVQQEEVSSVTAPGIPIVDQLDRDDQAGGDNQVEKLSRAMNVDARPTVVNLLKARKGVGNRIFASAACTSEDPSNKRRRLNPEMNEEDLLTVYGRPIITLLPVDKVSEMAETAEVASPRRLRSNSKDKAPVVSRAKAIAAGIRQYLEEMKAQGIARSVRPGEKRMSLSNKFCIAYGNNYRWVGNAIEGKRSDKYVLVYVVEEVNVRDGVTLYCCDKYIRDDPAKDQEGMMWFTKENKVSQPFFQTEIVRPLAKKPIIYSPKSPFVCYRVADLGDAAEKL